MKKPYVSPQLVPLNHPLQDLVTAACRMADDFAADPYNVEADTSYAKLLRAVKRLREQDQSEPPGRFFVLVGSR